MSDTSEHSDHDVNEFPKEECTNEEITGITLHGRRTTRKGEMIQKRKDAVDGGVTRMKKYQGNTTITAHVWDDGIPTITSVRRDGPTASTLSFVPSMPL